jgi:nucleotide-binding universal stress UspA family protein
MYKTILVPLDGSPRAESILPHVEKLAQQSKSKVIFLSVLPFSESIKHADGFHDLVDSFNNRKEETTEYLAGVQQDFQGKGIDAISIIEYGAVVETIITVAQKENADLIAIASHGRSGLSWVFYGSVSAGVLQRIDRPLLVIRSRNV